MTEYEARQQEFTVKVEVLIDEYWDLLVSPDPEDTDAVLDAASLSGPGDRYCEGWAVVMSAASIPDPEEARILIRYARSGQSPYMTAALLMDAGRLALGW